MSLTPTVFRSTENVEIAAKKSDMSQDFPDLQCVPHTLVQSVGRFENKYPYLTTLINYLTCLSGVNRLCVDAQL